VGNKILKSYIVSGFTIKGYFMRAFNAEIARGADIERTLHNAALLDDAEMAMECLRRGDDAALYKNGYTPIGVAALKKSLDVITRFREFYFESENREALVRLLEQPQGIVNIFGIDLPFLCPKFSNFNDIINSSELYSNGDPITNYCLRLGEEDASRELVGFGRNPDVRLPPSDDVRRLGDPTPPSRTPSPVIVEAVSDPVVCNNINRHSR
jgi:hypothetical protein